MFDKQELTQLQIAIYHRVNQLETDLKKIKTGDAGYDNTFNNLTQARTARDKIMAM